MADIVIRGMEMPQRCWTCRFCGFGGRMSELNVCMFTGESQPTLSQERMSKCPLVPLPEGHGRLGDLDKLEDAFIRYYLSQERSSHLVFTPVEIKQHFADMIGDWPTIVPAEGGGEDGN